VGEEARVPTILVLLVEDDPAEARLLIEISKPYPTPIEFHHLATGDEALAYLRRLQTDPAVRTPDAVILDLNLPGRDGRFVLSTIRSDRALNRLPVIILTASPADSDVLLAFDFKADAYLRKPVDLPQLAAAFERIEIGR
jgi:chemotaxis family two-component system response regulator Rcp1